MSDNNEHKTDDRYTESERECCLFEDSQRNTDTNLVGVGAGSF